MRIAALAALCLGGVLALGQTLDLAGPTTMGRCEEAQFSVTFTAGIQTASNIIFAITPPNLGFTYVSGSAIIALHDGVEIYADPAKVDSQWIWDLHQVLGEAYELPPGAVVVLEFALATGCGTISGTLSARVDYVEEGIPLYLMD
ncbi:MAG: hypothetical protein NZ651_04720, partial [Candidatus Bipolaricaulota bacterium]|nr:hypothetical protein [Candidatus Bipolaricaulota bacterium]MDW8127056.1 hypothetical protein [Candidatus Bipolaricaulota bacterium]